MSGTMVISKIIRRLFWFFFLLKVVYILDQVRALEKEMLLRIQKQGLDVTPKILIVSMFMLGLC